MKVQRRRKFLTETDRKDICTLCGSDALRCWGNSGYHTVTTVAGLETGESSLLPFDLLKCSSCGLIIKSPMVERQILEHCYRNSAESHWVSPANSEHRQFAKIERLAKDFAPGNRILDVGCSNGAMLRFWSDIWKKYGVEPSKKASQTAKLNGIDIIGNGVDSINEDHVFDVVSMIDVIEHLPDPGSVIYKIFRTLAKGGILIIVTGRTDHWWWKIAKSEYWYVSFPEHVCFYNGETFRFIADSNRGEIIYSENMCHYHKPKTLEYLKQLGKNTGFWLIKNSAQLGGVNQNKWLQRGYPSFTTARDHQLVVIRKLSI